MKKIRIFKFFLTSTFQRLFFVVLFIICCTGNGIGQTYRVGDLITNSDGSKGVVFFVHPDGSGGWMVALTDASTGCEWGTNADIPGLNNNNLSVYINTNIYNAALYDTSGYSNTQTIRAFQNNNSIYAAGKVDFENGWYLPSIGQLLILWGNQPFINNTLVAQGGTFLTPSFNYWSSSECDSSQAWNLSSDLGDARYNVKDTTTYRVRAVRNFSSPISVYDSSLTYLWSTGSTLPHIVAYPNSTTTYSVTVTSEMGCTNSFSQTIFVNSIYPQVIYDTVCLGSSYMGNGFDIGISDTQTVGTTLYTQTITQNGCQATLHLYLYRKSTTFTTLNVSLCEGEPYILNGVEYFSSGTYQQNLISQNGCDSLLTLNLSFYPNPNTVIQQISCDYYSWNGTVYNQSGNYTQIFSLPSGCDSTVILQLTILPNTSSTITQTVNQNQLPITFNGQVFTNNVNNYLITIPNSNGCDSVITYNLIVNWNAFTQLYDTICQNSLPYVWNGVTFNSPGNQTATFTSFNGADSIVNMSLVVISNTTSTITQTVNENQLPIIFNGHVFNGDVNNYLITIPNANGCDSIISFNLEVNWNTSSLLMESICESSLPYVWNGITFYNAMTQTITLTSYSGADSVVTMKLSIIPNTTSTFIQTVNEDQMPITFNGESFSGEVTNYLIIISNANGCDSLIYYTLQIIWENSIQISDTICQNDLPYVWNGFTFNNAGTHNAYLTSSTGEDSIVMMILVVNVPTYSTITQTINENQLPYTYNGHVFTNEVDYYTLMINNINGCDSIISFSLNINWNTSSHFIHSICQNSLPYVWNGITFNSAGNQLDTLTSFNGADSIITMTLIVYPNTSSIISQTVNENQLPFTFNGAVFTNEVSHYLITIPNSNGCDSAIFFTLHVNWNTSSYISDTICENSLPYVWNGITFYGASTQSSILTSYTGADSVVFMTLFVTPISVSNITQTVNENQLPVTFNGFTFYSNIANFGITLNNANGCDSLIYYTLHVHWNTINLITETICQDNLPYVLNGITFYSEGTHTDTLLSVFGSDSIVITTLIVTPNTESTISQVINENQLPITFNGQTYMNEVVNEIFTIPNSFGCDSVITYSLHINWNVNIHIYDTICQNSLPYVWNEITFNSEGSQIWTLTSYTGADSIVTMSLVVHTNTTSDITQIVNENELPIIFNGNSFSGEVDHYSIIIPNSNGCDSIINYSLQVNWNTYQSIDTTICSYDLPFIWHGFTFLNEGIKIDTLLNANNTFHLTTYTLHIDTLTDIQFSGFTNPLCPTITNQQIIANINSGTPPYSYLWTGDSIINALQNQALIKIAPISCGDQRKVFLEIQDYFGCIARDTALIEMNSPQAPSLSASIPAQNCLVNNCQFSVPNMDSLVRSYSIDNCYPSDSLIITQNPIAGTLISITTNVVVTIANSCGNSIQTTVSVNVPSVLSVSISNITPVSCYGHNTGGATAVPSGGTPNYSFSWSIHSTPSTIIANTNAISNVAAGTYRVTVTDQYGCTVTSNVTIQNQSAAMSPGVIYSNQSVCFGSDPAPLTGTQATGGINSYYQWQKSSDNIIFSMASGINNTQNYTPETLTQNTYYRRAWISVACGTVYSDTVLISFFPVSRDTIEDVVCQGFEYVNHGFNLTADSTNYQGEHSFYQYLLNIYNCDSIITLQLKVNPSLLTNIEDTICQGGSYLENGFNISSPNTDIAQVVELEMYLNSILGCDSIVSLALNVIDTSLTIEMITTDFCETEIAELVVLSSFDNFIWNTGETSQAIEIHQTGTYKVTASNEYCENFGIYTIQPCEYYLYLPNSFTPNNDGLNDFFTLSTNNEKQFVEFKIEIFNRWGQKIFESNSPYFKWNGYFNNQIVQNNQVYVYLIEYKFAGKGAKFIKGSVTVLY